MHAAGSATVIEVDALRKSYGGSVAVDDVSFTVQRGEIFGILGPNGAGKTTTVECLQGLRRRDGGHVRVLGLDPESQLAGLRRRIGSQLQESALPDRMRVWEALDLFASVRPEARPWRSLLEEWGLTSQQRSSFGGLSGGQKQRLFVALALLADPEVVFLDEMTQGLDPAARRVAWDLIRAVRDRGSTVLLVTHYMDEAEKLCDRLAIIADGRVVDVDTPYGLVQRHAPSIRVTFTTDSTDVSWLNQVAEVSGVSREGGRVSVEGSGAVLVRVAAALVAHDIVPPDLHAVQPGLEDVFLALTSPDRRAATP